MPYMCIASLLYIYIYIPEAKHLGFLASQTFYLIYVCHLIKDTDKMVKNQASPSWT